MKRYRLTESDLRYMIGNIVEKVLREDETKVSIPRFNGTVGNKEDEINFLKSLIPLYKKELFDGVYDDLYNYNFSDLNFYYENWGRDEGFSSGNELEFEYEFKDGDVEVSFNVIANVDVTEYPGSPGTYLDPPEYDEYDYKLNYVYIFGIYYCDEETGIEIYHCDDKNNHKIGTVIYENDK